MYHTIIRKKLSNVFSELNRGNYDAVLDGMAPEFEHEFMGSHALSGFRYKGSTYRKWFERLSRIFPDLRFEIQNIVVNGWPWNTTAAVEWVDRIGTLDGSHHQNSGVHIIRLRWGRVVKIRIYTDTQKVAQLCELQASLGVAEAVASPIVDQAGTSVALASAKLKPGT